MKRGDQYIRTSSVDRDRHDLQSFCIKLEFLTILVMQSEIQNSKNSGGVAVTGICKKQKIGLNDKAII